MLWAKKGGREPRDIQVVEEFDGVDLALQSSNLKQKVPMPSAGSPLAMPPNMDPAMGFRFSKQDLLAEMVTEQRVMTPILKESVSLLAVVVN